MADVETLRYALSTCKSVAVVGLSSKPHRPSYFVGKYLLDHDYTMIPVNPRESTILGQTCYPALADIPGPVDMVDVFRRTEDVLPIAEQAVAIGARCLWQQLGVNNTGASALARENGLDAVEDRCVKIEFARLFGGLGWAGVNTRVVSAKRPAYFANGALPGNGGDNA